MCVCVVEGEGGGRGSLPCSFLKIEKGGLILCKKCPAFGKMLPVCIHLWVKLPFKCNFKSIFEKKHQNFSLWSFSFVCRTWNVYWSAPTPRNLPCMEKFVAAWLRNWCGKLNNFLRVFFKLELWKSFSKFLKGTVFSNMEIYLKLEVAFLIHYPTDFSEIATVVSFFWCEKVPNSGKVLKLENEI